MASTRGNDVMRRILVCFLLLATLAVPCCATAGTTVGARYPGGSAGGSVGVSASVPSPTHRRALLASVPSEAPLDYTDYRFGTLRFEGVQPSDGLGSVSKHVPHMLDALVTVHLDKVSLVKGDSPTEDWRMIEGQSLTMYLHQHFDDLFDNDVYHQTLGALKEELSGLHFCPLDGDIVLAVNATIQAVQPLKRTADVSFLVGSRINVVVAHHATSDAEGAHAALALKNTAEL